MQKLSYLLHRRQFWLVLGLLVIDSLFFMTTDPAKVASFALIIGFVLFAVTVYWLVYFILSASSWYGLPLGRHRRRLAGVVTGMLGGLIALQSIGELSNRDVLVLLPLTLVAYLYMAYGWSAAEKRTLDL